MLNPDKLARLNELSKKSKTKGLSSSESAEQAELRQQYLSNFRKSMKNTIENTRIVDPNGNDVTPEKVKKIQNQRNLH
ncbi:hypothetical protein Q73_06470 [Bacillus coahuilensis m2-6]|uniref:UPF0291 protein Q75_06975 n=1 Tax=Bacillus coahuilensis p1.1.43 TaxID=1150625 RepID=A0A147K8Z9_9BACI|nr:DUF896 domain-containing protein [Bacillus coahuilensis]KUP06822.1 hypothetical protein Q75_06975 [Bacillus coahuilensis p1.1.43]KUP08379.1 hypothetical protein Q73_06470 [Bacillus coahuilensis m2-6]